MKFITLTQDDVSQIVNIDQIAYAKLEQAENSESWFLIVELKNDQSFVSVGSFEDMEKQFQMISDYLKSYDYTDVFYEAKHLEEMCKRNSG